MIVAFVWPLLPLPMSRGDLNRFYMKNNISLRTVSVIFVVAQHEPAITAICDGHGVLLQTILFLPGYNYYYCEHYFIEPPKQRCHYLCRIISQFISPPDGE